MKTNKIIIDSVKLGVSTVAGLMLSRLIAKNEKIAGIYPQLQGAAGATVSSAIFAGSIKMGKSIKDNSIRTGIQAGTGAAALIGILNIEKIKTNLPAPFQSMLAGDSSPVGYTVGANQLEQIVNLEAERLVRKSLKDAGFEVDGDGNPHQPKQIEQIETVGNDEIYSQFDGENDSIYSDF